MTVVERILELPVFRSMGGPAFRRAVLDTRLAGAYWRAAPALHRRRRHRSPDHVDPPADPFELVSVDPDRISRITGREFPVWTDRWRDFGAVKGGDWDERERPPISPSYEGPDPSLYLADRFGETPLHEALEAHFLDGVPWEELDFVREVKRRTRESEASVWHQCSTVPEIRQHCRHLDRLYRNMREQGCLSMAELNAREGRLLTFREVMENEILVDVARDGEPLFANGRHRVSIAKILGLDRIPVALTVRHRRWLDGPDRAAGVGADRGVGSPPTDDRPEPGDSPDGSR